MALHRSLIAVLLLVRVTSKGDPSCWGGGVNWEMCCAPHFGPQGNANCWDEGYSYERCCGPPEPTEIPAALPTGADQVFPSCMAQGVMLQHLGEHGVFTDLAVYGEAGCFMNDCKLTDKFKAVDSGICARACAAVEECTHWTYGMQDGAQKCFLRKSDAGRRQAHGWVSGAKACGPPRLPLAFVALKTAWSPALMVAAAINTWIFAIDHLKRAFAGRVDADTMHHIEQIGKDSENFKVGLTAEYRPSDKDFPRMVYNNRLIFNHLHATLTQQPAVDLSEADASLPTPLRFGRLCGKSSCYDL
eukprot:TRINITY_DN38285_c0_g1_i1.p1 TRINITY_DN38285_c0_g1~~TRINITY_DN38285_c0_g1_i1.p1  ORF type:complete len:314 (-),score=64.69 TRINITY_DN38285_c0_g1_i1:34-939(-)